MVMFPVHQVWPKPSCKAQWKGKEDKADKGRGGKTTSRNGQACSSASPGGQWRTGKNGENWLQNYLWCPNDPRGEGIDDDDGDAVCSIVCRSVCSIRDSYETTIWLVHSAVCSTVCRSVCSIIDAIFAWDTNLIVHSSVCNIVCSPFCSIRDVILVWDTKVVSVQSSM